MCTVERDARSQLIQSLKVLNLDFNPNEQKPKVGRPLLR